MNVKKARILLASVFIARGTSFLFSKTLMQSMSPMSILAVRFVLAFVVLAFIFHKKLKQCCRNALRGGVILGVLYSLCMFFEMFGLRLIDSGVCALIENMAIVLVPLLAAVIGRTLPKKKTMICAVLAVAGVGFLSMTQNQGKSAALGIVLSILAAITFAVCIMMTEKVSREADPLTIGIIQIGVMGGISLAAAFLTGGFMLPQTSDEWVLLLLLVLVCSCFGFAFQPVGQKYVPAEEAAVWTVVNPLTASILGLMAGGEGMSILKAAGYVLILLSLVLYNVKKKNEIDSKLP